MPTSYLRCEWEILQEIGELQNIESFPFKKKTPFSYSFSLPGKKGKGAVVFEDNTDLVHNQFIRIPPAFLLYKTDKVYILGYAINSSTQQGLQATPHLYFQIMKTVLEVVRDFLDKNQNSFILFYETPRLGRKVGPKFNHYVEILNKHIPSEYVQTGVEIGDINGIIFGPYRKWKPKEKEKLLFDPYTGEHV